MSLKNEPLLAREQIEGMLTRPNVTDLLRQNRFKAFVKSRQDLMRPVYRLYKTAGQLVLDETGNNPEGFKPILANKTQDFMYGVAWLALSLLFNPLPTCQWGKPLEATRSEELASWRAKDIIPELRNLAQEVIDACVDAADKYRDYFTMVKAEQRQKRSDEAITNSVSSS